MARLESKAIMGYLPIEERHYPALLSLVAPATPAARMLDPFAGEGAFLEAAARSWHVTPYVNELDAGRAAVCVTRFGPTHAVRCDVERLVASTESFGVVWANPPYDHDCAARDNKRVEFTYLRHAWKWAQIGGLVLWCVYQQHLTEAALAFLSTHSRTVEIWALPGKHQGEYDQVVVACIKGTADAPESLLAHLLSARLTPTPLTVQVEPRYRLPPPPEASRRFVFAPDTVDPAQGQRLIEAHGAWLTHGVQALVEVPRPVAQADPIVPPRPGHMALLLAAGVANGALLETAIYGTVAVRGKTVRVEQVARRDVEALPHDPERQVVKTTVRLKPTTTLTLLAQDGTRVEMAGDAAILDFITQHKAALATYLNDKFRPAYAFDFNGLGRWLGSLRLRGKHPLYTAQQHVVAAITCGFQHRKGLLLVGAMGTGKTAMGGSVAVALAAGLVAALRTQVKPTQVVLIVAPPHLLDKWARELHDLAPTALVERLNHHENVKAFMDKAARLGAHLPKIGLIKRDMTKLGAARSVAVVWRTVAQVRWDSRAPTPAGFTAADRLLRQRVATCPHCGAVVQQEKGGVSAPASETWLASGKRSCQVCGTPLWREARDSHGKAASTSDLKPPRYRLDAYLKRRYPERIALLVWDEAHEAAHGDTGNGEAFGRLAGLADKVLAMTGTPFNGRASSLFNLEYALNPRTRERYAWGGAARVERKGRGDKGIQAVIAENKTQRGRAESRWVADMGVQEQVLEERPTYDRDTGVYTGTSTYQRPYEEAPGISPLLVAELLDHAVFFSLGDLGKALPAYEEIAVGVDMEPDLLAAYTSTRQHLIQYLVERRWEGDTTFRGAYLQWAMGWPNTPFRPYDILHHLKHPLTGQKTAHLVKALPAYGEERLYAKERALLDLVRDELAHGRSVVIFLRQTATRDIQPRLADLVRRHVPAACPFILKNTVSAERREKAIEAEVARGTNVILANPELVKTGLDLVFAPTLIFYEIVFNLGTMMQAAGRSYRLNQTHAQCKTYYLFAKETMEQHRRATDEPQAAGRQAAERAHWADRAGRLDRRRG